MAFHGACGLDALTIANVQAVVRKRVLRTFVRRNLIDKDDGKEMSELEHDGGFSVDASVCMEGTDRPGLERLLRYCARPPFALEHLQQRDAEHVIYHRPKPIPGKPSDLLLTPREQINEDRRLGAAASDGSPPLLEPPRGGLLALTPQIPEGT